METEVMKVGSAALTTVDDYAPELMAKAYDLYLSSNLTTVDIAIDLGLPQKVVASWVRRGGWKEKKRECNDTYVWLGRLRRPSNDSWTRN